MPGFDFKLSLMDIFAIAVGAAGVYMATVENGSQIAHLDEEVAEVKIEMRREIDRVEDDLGKDIQMIADDINELNTEVKETRKESAEGRKDIVQKLDRLIERKLDGN